MDAPPSIANVALEFIRKSYLKRPHLCHIIAIPKLMTYAWRKHLIKSCDLSFYVDTGAKHWTSSNHESLFVAFYLPQLHCPPWCLKRTRFILALERELRQVQCSKKRNQGDVLRKFWTLLQKLPTMSKGMVWKVLCTNAGRQFSY